jgi:DNA-binding transcriptional ArsR family regulator
MPPIVSTRIEDELREGPEISPELDQLMRNARKASDFLKALSHENRLLLLCLLAERERSVTELENILSLRQPTVSQQLARLRLEDIVTTRRDGRLIFYRISDPSLTSLVSVLYEMYCGPNATRIISGDPSSGE